MTLRRSLAFVDVDSFRPKTRKLNPVTTYCFSTLGSLVVGKLNGEDPGTWEYSQKRVKVLNLIFDLQMIMNPNPSS